jgi:hypothetical protein
VCDAALRAVLPSRSAVARRDLCRRPKIRFVRRRSMKGFTKIVSYAAAAAAVCMLAVVVVQSAGLLAG